jgi:hypothetical protein
MPINLNPNIKPETSVFKKSFEYVNLPFPFLRLSWNNGNSHATSVKGAGSAQYFGGFQRGSKDIQEDLATMKKTTLPIYFKEEEWVNTKDEAYMAWGSRSVWAAPILARVDWYEGRDKYTSEIRLKHRLDFLVYLADRDKNTLIPWGPAVITAYGFAATSIEKAFKGFAQETLDVRKRFAGGIDAMFFYHLYGTFGNQRNAQKAGDTAAVVPCVYDKPADEWSERMLENRFVGDDIGQVLVDLQKQAKEWFEDTNENRQKKNGAPKATNIPFGQLTPDTFMDETPDDPL